MSRLTPIKGAVTVASGYTVASALIRTYPSLASVFWIKDVLFEYQQGWGRSDHVALTFDDGPDPISTPLILRELDRLGVKATFFMLGSMAEAYPYVAQMVLDTGHEIALHGQWHRNHLFRSAKTIRYDMERSMEQVQKATGVQPIFFRPPYGVLTEPTLKSASDLSLRPVLWGAWGRDWRSQATSSQVIIDIKKRFKPGVTVLLHDSDSTSSPGSFRATLGAIEPLLTLCDQQDCKLGRLKDHGI